MSTEPRLRREAGGTIVPLLDLARSLALLMLVVLATLLATALLAGCAGERTPYVRTQIVGEYRLDWFRDGPDLRIRAVNPTERPVRVDVQCVGAEQVWRVDLAPRSEAWGIGQVMNRDAIFDPCWVKTWSER